MCLGGGVGGLEAPGGLHEAAPCSKVIEMFTGTVTPLRPVVMALWEARILQQPLLSVL